MRKFGNAVVKHRVLILVLALLLLIPSVLGMAATRINYDMLDYLPGDMETCLLYTSTKYGSFTRLDGLQSK